MSGSVAVLDVGKTNVKLAVFDEEGALLWERTTPNRILPGPPYPHADVEAVWDFYVRALRDASAAHAITTVVPTTHGCAAALVDESDLVLPVLDYEFAGVDEIEPLYASMRPPYSRSLSPKLPGGLNIGRQLAWQKHRFPRRGELRGDVAPDDRPALATLYVALMTDLMLNRLGAIAGDLIIEGSFAANKSFCALLAALRPKQRVLTGGDSSGTARGAALLAQWPAHNFRLHEGASTAPVILPGLAAYRQAWTSAIC